MTSTEYNQSVLKNQLLWRCRLGTRELELLLYRYIDKHYASLTTEQIETFQEFVELNPEQLNAWLLQDVTVSENNKYANIINAIKDFN